VIFTIFTPKQLYRQLTCPRAPTVTFARRQCQPTVSGCGQLADGLKVGRRDIGMF